MRNPQAVVNRCMWWRGLTNWPNGTDADDLDDCIERAFGRTSQANGRRILEQVEGINPEAGNDRFGHALFFIAVIIVGYVLCDKVAK